MATEHSLPPPARALIKPLSRLLRPLVRLLIGSGVTFPMLAELLRALYVEVAARDLLRAAKSRTDSRISLLTGVHRKEIRRLREQEVEADQVPPRVTLTSALVSRWLALPSPAGTPGEPPALPRTGDTADLPSFERLVEAVTTDVRPRAVLDDLLSQEIVALDAAGLVHLNTEAFIPHPGTEEQLFYFARNLHDHIAAGAANVAARGAPPFLDRSLHYDRLSPAAAVRLEALARDAAQRMLVELNREAATLAEADDKLPRLPDAAFRRVNLGVYLYSDDDNGDRRS